MNTFLLTKQNKMNQVSCHVRRYMTMYNDLVWKKTMVIGDSLLSNLHESKRYNVCCYPGMTSMELHSLINDKIYMLEKCENLVILIGACDITSRKDWTDYNDPTLCVIDPDLSGHDAITDKQFDNNIQNIIVSLINYHRDISVSFLSIPPRREIRKDGRYNGRIQAFNTILHKYTTKYAIEILQVWDLLLNNFDSF